MKDEFNDLIPANLDDDTFEGGSLQGLEEYQRFEVEEKHKAIKKEAQDLVTSLVKIYFDAEMIDEHEHLKAISSIETSNLIGLIQSARYAQHAVSTLMRKIDAGLHADLAVYPILIDLQKSAIDIQMKVANYSRTLSSYLLSVKEDLNESANSTIEILSRVEQDSIDRGEELEKQTDDSRFRGTLATNQYFRERMEEIQREKEKRDSERQKALDNKEYPDYTHVTKSEQDVGDDEFTDFEEIEE